MRGEAKVAVAQCMQIINKGNAAKVQAARRDSGGRVAMGWKKE